MKKKILILTLVLLIVAVASGFAIGIGASFGLDVGENVSPGIMLSLDLDQIPFLLGVGYDFQDNATLATTFDYIMVRENLTGMLNLYAGAGGFLIYQDAAAEQLDFGLRVPFALYMFPVDFFEVFLEAAPAFRFYPSINLDVQTAIGFRFWFN